MESVLIIGGGNIGTYFACAFASKGYKVNIFTSKPGAYGKTLQTVNPNGDVLCRCTPNVVSADIIAAIKNCNTVLITHPSFMFGEDAALLLPHIKPGIQLGIIPGTGGAEFAFNKCIKKGAALFGLQRVPCVARLVEYGKTVCIDGKRDKLFLASIPSGKAPALANVFSNVFDMPCEALPNYLCVTLTPSNPILHTSRLATMFKDYKPGVVYKSIPLFYGEWSNESSKRLLACDAEHRQILKKLDFFDLSSVKSLVEHYDNSNTPQKMTSKLCSIKSLHNLSTPAIEVDGGYIPDFSSRYFTADFPYGLAIIEQFANILGVNAKSIKKTMAWYRQVCGNVCCINLSDYGIKTPQDIKNYY